MKKSLSVMVITLSLFARTLASSSAADDVIESLSYKSIKAIHKHLDDDQDGDVNLEESTEFMVDELHVNDKKRHSSFHGNDSLISVDDLWHSWLQNEVHNWTIKQVADWVSNIVSLPQYSKSFSLKKIDGRMLPRFTNEASSLYNKLGITDAKHRKKISLRATDIVLFGPPVEGYTKDVIVAIVVTLMALACCFALSEKTFAKKQIEQMMKDVEFMQLAEENLKNTQERLKKAELEHRSTILLKTEIEDKLKKEIEAAKKEAERLHEERTHHEEERIKMSLVERELLEVQRALQKAEAEMEKMAPRSSRSLQQWLYITYRKESKHFIAKKNNALLQMHDAKEACEKIKKKRIGLFGSLRLVHGQTIDEVDQRILSARSALAEVTNELQERQHRWRQIEELCGFPIVSDGLLNLSLEIEDKSHRSSVARALAVCANLGGIGSIPSSLPMPASRVNLTDFSSSCSSQLKCLDDLEFENDRHVRADLSDSFSSSSKLSPIRHDSSSDKVESLKTEGNYDEGLTFLSSTKDKAAPSGDNTISLSKITVEPLEDATDDIDHSKYSKEPVEKVPNNRYSLETAFFMEKEDINHKLRVSRSMPLFTFDKGTSNADTRILRHLPFPKVSIDHSSTAQCSKGTLWQSDNSLTENDKCPKLVKPLASSEENLSQKPVLDKCFGSNEELSFARVKSSKKQKSKFTSFVSKKPRSFDERSSQKESAIGLNKKKSILPKFWKK